MCGYYGLVHAHMLNRLLQFLFDWLSPSDPVCCGDLIFALAGRHSRKVFSLELLHQGIADNLLLSVGPLEIRRLRQLSWPTDINPMREVALAQPDARHYFVSLEGGSIRVEIIHRGRLGTFSEIRGLARWLEQREDIRSVIVVSSAPHLRRVRACCRTLLPARLHLRFVPTPNDDRLTRSTWWHHRRSRAMVVKEVAKLIVYGPLLIGAGWKRL